jgi:hypothetical protein
MIEILPTIHHFSPIMYRWSLSIIRELFVYHDYPISFETKSDTYVLYKVRHASVRFKCIYESRILHNTSKIQLFSWFSLDNIFIFFGEYISCVNHHENKYICFYFIFSKILAKHRNDKTSIILLPSSICVHKKKKNERTWCFCTVRKERVSNIKQN